MNGTTGNERLEAFIVKGYFKSMLSNLTHKALKNARKIPRENNRWKI